MKSIKTLLAVVALSVSGLVLAEGGSAQTFAAMQQVRQASLVDNQQVSQKQIEAPVATNHAKQAGHANC